MRNSFKFSWKHLKWMGLFWGKKVGEFHQPFSHKNLLKTNRTLRKVKDWQTLERERESSIKVKRTGGSRSDLLRGAGVLGHWNRSSTVQRCSPVDIEVSQHSSKSQCTFVFSFFLSCSLTDGFDWVCIIFSYFWGQSTSLVQTGYEILTFSTARGVFVKI